MCVCACVCINLMLSYANFVYKSRRQHSAKRARENARICLTINSCLNQCVTTTKICASLYPHLAAFFKEITFGWRFDDIARGVHLLFNIFIQIYTFWDT